MGAAMRVWHSCSARVPHNHLVAEHANMPWQEKWKAPTVCSLGVRMAACWATFAHPVQRSPANCAGQEATTDEGVSSHSSLKE